MEKNTLAKFPWSKMSVAGKPATGLVLLGVGLAVAGWGLLGAFGGSGALGGTGGSIGSIGSRGSSLGAGGPIGPRLVLLAVGGVLLVLAAGLRFQAQLRALQAAARQSEALRQTAESDLDHYFSTLPTGAMTIDSQGRTRRFNAKAKELLGLAEEELKRVNWTCPAFQVLKVDGNTLNPLEMPMNVARATGLPATGVVMGLERGEDGDFAWVTCSAHPKRGEDGRVTEVVCILEDGIQHRSAEAELARQSFRDRLTSLPNRALFMERLSQALLRSERLKLFSAVLYLDLDRFKVINDSLSHEIGDQLLVQVAKRYSACLRPEDTVARLGGDEFVVLFGDIHSVNEGLSVADRIAQGNSQPFQIQGHEIFITCSMGIALSACADTGPSELIRDAEVAMYRAKAKGGRSIEVFDPSMNAQALARFQLESDLRRGLERKEFLLYYQPLVGLRSGRLEGWEALIRWQHPEWGMVSPGAFIPLAEETGVIVPLGKWVLEEACRQAALWARAFPSDVSRVMNVNLSGRQFGHRDLTQDVMNAVIRSGLDPHTLKLELTESVMMRDPVASLEAMQVFRGKNIHLVVDDFGTGYSSLSYLKRFPLDTLKIDKSFVDGLGKDPENTGIVTAIISLAHTLGMSVTAEGIETRDQLEHLQQLNCDQGQGYHFSRPLPAEAAEALLARNPTW